MDYKGRMDAYAIDSFSSLPGELVSTYNQTKRGKYHWYI